jgi:hypothetical protein
MNNNILLAVIAVIFISGTTFTQHQETNEKPLVYKGSKHHLADSNTILYAFKNGTFHGHLRYFFMATDNARDLTDYFANAAGGGLHYQTASYKNFRFGVSGFYVFNIGSTDLDTIDPTTGQVNRYEIGLFDQEDPHNHKDIDRLEELFLKYHALKGHFTLGRQLINTPFINLQDGRMRPTGVEGIWYESDKLKNTKIQGGYLYAVSPRGTTKWYEIQHSIGLYPSGVNPNGTKSDYHDNVSSRGLFSLGLTQTIKPSLKVSLWDLYVDNMFNTAFAEIEYKKELKLDRSFYSAGQFIRQDAINEGGNSNIAKTYFTPKGKSMTFGFKVGLKSKTTDLSLNYNRITAHGRYLMPREWGRDAFYTFLPRERNEGFGDVHALVVKGSKNFPKIHLKTALAGGIVSMPSVNDYRLNKYGMPSYAQVNFDVRYGFDKLLKGLDAQLLIVYKHGLGDTYGKDRFVINKVDMILYNFVLNYHF